MATRQQLLDAVAVLKVKLARAEAAEDAVAALLGKTPEEFRATPPEQRRAEAEDLRTKARERPTGGRP